MTKNGAFALVRCAAIAGCAGMVLLCGRMPTGIGSNNFPLQLSLENGTKTSATFSGEPIIAMLTLPDSVEFDSIAWHSGGGHVGHTGITPSMKRKEFDVQLFWTSAPLCIDTATKTLFDTIYVSTHGETQRSNTVRVTVTNVPPVIDSVKIGTLSARSNDTIRYSFPSTDTSASLPLRVSASDVNRDTLRYDWLSTRDGPLAPVFSVVYAVPKVSFVDTVFVTVYDGKGGSAGRIIILSKLPPDRPPVIDSIMVGTRTFAQDTTFHVYFSLSLDTVKLRVFAHDSDIGDTLTYQWTKKNMKDSLVRSVSSQATLVCDTIFRRARDTLRTADTITVVVRDPRGDSAKTVVRLVQGHINTPPKLDSISVNGLVQCKGPLALIAHDTVVGCTKATLTLRVFSSDPDSGDTVKLSVRAKQASLVSKLSDTVAQYVCKDSSYTDTVVCVVKDVAGDSAVKKIVISVVNRPPAIDSIRVNGVMQCRGPSVVLARDSAFGSARATLALRVFSSDPDSGDTVRLSVRAKQASLVTRLSDSTVQYACKDSAYTDTVVCVVKDLEGDSAVKRIVISVINRAPSLDSIKVNGVTQCKGPAVALSRDTAIATAKDTFLLRIFASDLDPADTVKLSVSAKQSSSVTKLSDTTAQYACMDSQYTDTVVCVVRDLAGDSAVKRIVISVIDRPPSLDSIKINGVTQCKGATVLTILSASGNDTVSMLPYSSDPDKGDSVQVTMSSRQTSALSILPDKSARYVCIDSIYNDTVTFAAKDLFGSSAKKSVVIAVVNRPPLCDSMSVADSVKHDTLTFKAGDSLASGSASIGVLDSVKVRLYAHDPDAGTKDSIAQVQWTLSSGRTMKLLDTKGLFVQYPGPAAAGTDTVLVKVSDTKQKSAKMSLIFNIK